MTDKKLKIAIGTDHAGFPFKKDLVMFIESLGHQALDFGCPGPDPCDYPPVAIQVGRAVSSQKADRGVLLCGTGAGMCMVANKIRGVRAGVSWNDEIAKLLSEHNRSNVLCLPARFASLEQMKSWIKIWLETPYSEEERHLRRLEEIKNLEKR
jgi:ribose 5-phosphate isomerase B